MTTRTLDSPPALGRLYVRALATARSRRGDRLPETVYELADVAVDRDHLAGYDAVCGFRLADRLPPTYPHVLAFPLAMSLMTDADFPFALPGLVHVANRITQRRPLRLSDRLSFRVEARDLRPHDRGRQFDVVAEAAVDGETVWTGVSTYLRRGGDSGGSGGSRSAAAREAEPELGAPSAIWRVGEDAGRRYAGVSGDSNPIHLHPLTARLFGFPRAIAHGMWLKARCLAALEGRLPDDLDVRVDFKSPLLLPATVAFRSAQARDSWSFSVRDARTGRPHLEGTAGGA